MVPWDPLGYLGSLSQKGPPEIFLKWVLFNLSNPLRHPAPLVDPLLTKNLDTAGPWCEVYFFSFSGCWRSRQNSAFVAPLLHGHPGPNICGGLRGPGPDRRGPARASPNHQRQRNAGSNYSRIRKQARLARRYYCLNNSGTYLLKCLAILSMFPPH